MLGVPRLNLAAASKVFILEPQWKPIIEKQAVGRVQRLGQDRLGAVVATRALGTYLVRETVETVHFPLVSYTQLLTSFTDSNICGMVFFCSSS